MNKVFSLVSLLMASLVLFSACDDESGNLQAPTADQLLTRTWRVQDIEVYENGEEVSDAEYRNTTITFRPDGTYSVDVTNAAFPMASGTWAWTNPEVKRNIILDQGTEQEVLVKVEELQADLLEVEMEREGGVVNGRTASAVRTIPDYRFVITFRSI